MINFLELFIELENLKGRFLLTKDIEEKKALELKIRGLELLF